MQIFSLYCASPFLVSCGSLCPKKNCTNAFFIPTPPIHKRTYEFNLLDIVCLGGHTEADETKEEEVLHKLNRRASFINPADLASLGLQRAPDLVKPETLSDEGSPREDYAEPSQKSSSGGGGGGTAVLDPAVTQLLYTMNERLADLAGVVDNLSARVDNMAGIAEQPVMMVPQRIRMQMNNRIEAIQDSMGGIDERVQMLASRANSPILMVPQYGAPGGVD